MTNINWSHSQHRFASLKLCAIIVLMKSTNEKTRTRDSGALSNKGATKRIEVLVAARSILVEEGNVALTARRVARELGVSLSHVQYYFPDRDEMIKAILQSHMEDAKERVTRRGHTANPMRDVLKVILKDQRSRESCRIFWELWAVTGRADKISHLLNDFHHDYVDAVIPYLQEINRELKPEEVRVRAVLIVSMLEGLSLFRGYGRKSPVPFSQLDPAVLSAINAIALIA